MAQILQLTKKNKINKQTKMKKQVIIVLAVLVTTISFAQKKELKAVGKALKKDNFTEAKTLLSQVDGMVSTMDDKFKGMYYALKSEALYAKGNGTAAEINEAVELAKQAADLKNTDVNTLISTMSNEILKRANSNYTNKDYKEAAKDFENLYKLSNSDNDYLYYAATSAVLGKDNATALNYYRKLYEKGYTGVRTEYTAVNKETGEEEVLPKETRDLYLKSGSYIKPGERKTESKRGEIIKNMGLILASQGKKEEALALFQQARKEAPNDVNLLINEANLHLELKDETKFNELMEKAVSLDPTNPSLFYNIGVISMGKNDFEKAKKSFEKALSLNPSFKDAALNLSTMYINQGNELVKQMNALGTSAADNAKYDSLKAQKTNLYQSSAGVLENFLSNNVGDKDVLEQLYNIYNALGDTTKANAIKAKM